MDFWVQMWEAFMNWLRPLSEGISVSTGADITPENILVFGVLLVISLVVGGGRVYIGSRGDDYFRRRRRR